MLVSNLSSLYIQIMSYADQTMVNTCEDFYGKKVKDVSPIGVIPPYESSKVETGDDKLEETPLHFPGRILQSKTAVEFECAEEDA